MYIYRRGEHHITMTGKYGAFAGTCALADVPADAEIVVDNGHTKPRRTAFIKAKDFSFDAADRMLAEWDRYDWGVGFAGIDVAIEGVDTAARGELIAWYKTRTVAAFQTLQGDVLPASDWRELSKQQEWAQYCAYREIPRTPTDKERQAMKIIAQHINVWRV